MATERVNIQKRTGVRQYPHSSTKAYLKIAYQERTPGQLRQNSASDNRNMEAQGPKKHKGGYKQINKALNICAFEDYLEKQHSRLPELADVEQLSPRVLRVLGQNAGKASRADCTPHTTILDLDFNNTIETSSLSKAQTHT